MLPNALPVVVIFGSMGLLGIDVDVGSMMTASIALGVAVDDTIHYLTWYRQDFERLGDRHQAILAAYSRCALPTMQAAAISGLGLSVFALSTFTPTQRFGYLMLSILVCGVVAELIMLPALLAGPLGRFCDPRPSRKAKAKAGRDSGGRTKFRRHEAGRTPNIRRRRIRPTAHHGRRTPGTPRRPAAARPRTRHPRAVTRAQRICNTRESGGGVRARGPPWFFSPVGTTGCSQGRQPLDTGEETPKPRRGDRNCRTRTCRPYGACGQTDRAFQGLTPLATSCRRSAAKFRRSWSSSRNFGVRRLVAAFFL